MATNIKQDLLLNTPANCGRDGRGSFLGLILDTKLPGNRTLLMEQYENVNKNKTNQTIIL